MLSLFRPSFEVVKEGRISNKIRHLQDQLWVSFCLVPAGPTQNQEVTTSKIVTFFIVPVWCQDLGENGYSFKEFSSFQIAGRILLT